MRVEWERDWGEPTDESESRKLRNHTFELLRKDTCEHHPILKKIKEREYEVERLAEDFIARAADVPKDDRWSEPLTLERMLRETCEELGFNSERAKILRAAMRWSEKRDEMDELKRRAGGILYYYADYPEIDPWDYEEEYQARSSLEWTIRDVMTEYNGDWDKDYEFREEVENFLSDIASERCYIREDFDRFCLYENVNKYLENPTWHSLMITDFLLVDLIDMSLIDLETNFQFGLFPARLADQFGGIGSYFVPFINSMSPGLSPKAKRMRRKWRFKNLIIGSGLIYIWIGSWEGEKIVRLLVNHGLNLPSWIFTVLGYVGIGFLVHPIISLLYEFINKIRTGYNKLAKAANEFVVIRLEIASRTYHAETLIERLKKLEGRGVVIHSLTYALLEMRGRQ